MMTVPAVTTIVDPITSVPVRKVAVGAEVGPPLKGVVLWKATVGDGPDQLGLGAGECGDCGPWSPIVTGGTVVVLDQQNNRWLSVHADHTTVAAKLDPGTVPAGQPVLAPDGLIYAPFRLDNSPGPDGQATWVVYGYEPDDLAAAVVEVPIDGSMYTTVEVDGDQLLANFRSIRRFSDGAPAKVTTQGTSVTVDTGTLRTIWTFPDGWAPGQPHVLSDGSVVVRGWNGRIALLTSGGKWATNTASGINSANNGEITVDDNGILQLELIGGNWQIVRYLLPTG